MEKIDLDTYEEDLLNLRMADLFPKTILYKEQEEEIYSDSSRNNNINNIYANVNVDENFEVKGSVNNFNNSHKNNNTKNSSKLQSQSQFQSQAKTKASHHLNIRNKKFSKEIAFSDNIIYDILIKDNLLIACGGPHVKVFNLHDTNDYVTFNSDNEDFYAISYTEIDVNSGDLLKLLAAGGKKSEIKIIDIKENNDYELIGHRNEIYDLKFCGNKDKSYLLLSASQDYSIRLWNVLTRVQICVFGGPSGGHNAECISIDWNLSGECFVSSGIDYFIKIWGINEQIQKNILLSKQICNHEDKKRLGFKTVLKSEPIFSCNTVHENYVDCVKFNGNFILSKSVDGVIYEWMPFFNKENDSFMIINTYKYEICEKIWYVKFGLELFNKNLLGVGNTLGKISLFRINEEIDDSDDEMNYFHVQKPIEEFETDGDALIRCVSFDRDTNYFAVGDNDGNIYLYKLN